LRVVLQRVLRASVTVDGERVSEIGRGYLLLVGVGRGDPSDEAERMAEKIVNLRLFADHEGMTNLPLAGVDGEILVVRSSRCTRTSGRADARRGAMRRIRRSPRCASRRSPKPSSPAARACRAVCSAP
jgi:D-tyrosyl-tRNA(Tyr) deacylase